MYHKALQPLATSLARWRRARPWSRGRQETALAPRPGSCQLTPDQTDSGGFHQAAHKLLGFFPRNTDPDCRGRRGLAPRPNAIHQLCRRHQRSPPRPTQASFEPTPRPSSSSAHHREACKKSRAGVLLQGRGDECHRRPRTPSATTPPTGHTEVLAGGVRRHRNGVHNGPYTLLTPLPVKNPREVTGPQVTTKDAASTAVHQITASTRHASKVLPTPPKLPRINPALRMLNDGGPCLPPNGNNARGLYRRGDYEILSYTPTNVFFLFTRVVLHRGVFFFSFTRSVFFSNQPNHFFWPLEALHRRLLIFWSFRGRRYTHHHSFCGTRGVFRDEHLFLFRWTIRGLRLFIYTDPSFFFRGGR